MSVTEVADEINAVLSVGDRRRRPRMSRSRPDVDGSTDICAAVGHFFASSGQAARRTLDSSGPPVRAVGCSTAVPASQVHRIAESCGLIRPQLDQHAGAEQWQIDLVRRVQRLRALVRVLYESSQEKIGFQFMNLCQAFRMTALLASFLPAVAFPGRSSAALITGGEATFTMTEGLAASIGELNAYFSAAVTRAGVLANPAPGDLGFTRLSGPPGSVKVVDSIRPSGVTPTPYPGTPGVTRSPQMTTLDLDPTNILGSWSASNDAFAFVGNTSLGEQIALTNMQRWTGPFTGSLLYGDFALRYVPGRADGTRSGLVLTSNIDFLSAAWADIANASIAVNGNQLTISGDLFLSGGLFVLDPGAVLGTDFGDFQLIATLDTPAVVPEPSSLLLLSSGAFGGVLTLSRRRKRLAQTSLLNATEI